MRKMGTWLRERARSADDALMPARPRVVVAALVAAILCALAGASAAVADNEQIKLTPTGQAAAKKAVLTRADLGTAAGWTGGAAKPILSSSLQCSSYDPKQSDLVVIGAAHAVWKNTGIELDSQADVLRTSQMVQLDWRRSVLAPQVMTCARQMFSKSLPSSTKVVSFVREAFPQIVPNVRKYRLVVSVKGIQVMVDLLLLVNGQTEITLSTTAPLSAQSVMSAAEVRLAEALVARTSNGSATVA
jgi:hypothetical protein